MKRVRYSPRPSPSRNRHSCPRSLQHVRKPVHLLLPELRFDHFPISIMFKVSKIRDRQKSGSDLNILDPNTGHHIFFFK